MSFVHLHLHTQFSLLDGAIKLGDLIQRAKQYEMPAVAITDHGNMFGAIKFYQSATRAGIKPIIGSEVYVAPKGRGDRTQRKSYHLILLAKDLEGYRNLCRLSSIGYLQGFYYVPRIDWEVLQAHSRGLICTTACIGGEMGQAILRGDTDHAMKTAKEYDALFGRGNYYLELQHNGYPDQEKVNAELLNISEITGIPVVATNDCHYLDQAHADAHEVLMAIQTGKTMEAEDRLSHDAQELYFKSPDIMFQQFKGLERALEATEEIAAKINLQIPDLGVPKLPHFVPPGNQDLEDYLRELTNKGLQDRLVNLKITDPDEQQRYQDRLDLEVRVIIEMGFVGYFLIVYDFIRWAKENSIPVGPGRGSGAGSLAAYSLGITDLDPLRYGLLFERFLNPERVSMPDFDIDFCKDKRDQVIEYVADKYGRDRVGQIITYSSLNARGVIKDVGRALGMSFADTDRVTKLVPVELGIELKDALQKEPKLRALRDSEPLYTRLFEVSLVLEGLHRHAGVHAAGIVIGQEPLLEICPLLKTNDGDVVTQYAKDEAEAVGLVKFDFLGLKTLTVIDVALRLIEETTGEPLKLDALPLDDKAVYDLISTAETTGVFQLESSGFRDLLRRLRPDTFEDIIAVLALYRPGPLDAGMVDQYVRRKRGDEPVTYFHPSVKEILKETYGVVVYQEQVMQISCAIAGYSLGRADILRKAMGKKKKEIIDAERAPFIKASIARGHKKKEMETLFETLEAFARYGFNKSHSAAYAVVTFQTAYIKAHFPVEFICALMTCDMDRTDKMVLYVSEAKRLGIQVRVPDINRSRKDFSVVDGEILMGLGGIKNVGGSAIEAIVEERTAAGPFESFYDFCMRVDLRRVNRRVIESLVHGGAFDQFDVNRARIEERLDDVLGTAQKAQRQKATGQLALFGGGSADSSFKDPLEARKGERMSRGEKKLALQKEKENLGFYLSAHPLDALKAEIKAFTSHTILGVQRAAANRPVRVAGVVSALKAKIQKNGGKMGRFTLEDQEGFIEVMAFSKAFEAGMEKLEGNEPVLIEGAVMVDGDGENTIHRIRAEKVLTFPEVRLDLTRRVRLRIREGVHDREAIACLHEVMRSSDGEIPVTVLVEIPGSGTAALPLSRDYRVMPDDDWVTSAFKILGAGGVIFDKKTPDEWLSSTPKSNNFRRGGDGGNGGSGGSGFRR
ncbi:MAG: DNA polymerase III subunit alpha [Pseudomonadota bacterium]